MWHTNVHLPATVKEQNVFSFTEQNIITQFYFYKTAILLLLPLFPPPQQATIYLHFAENELSISTFPVSPRYSPAAPGPHL